jgi:hypothetical protein
MKFLQQLQGHAKPKNKAKQNALGWEPGRVTASRPIGSYCDTRIAILNNEAIKRVLKID